VQRFCGRQGPNQEYKCKFPSQGFRFARHSLAWLPRERSSGRAISRLTLQSTGHAPASRVMPVISNVRPHWTPRTMSFDLFIGSFENGESSSFPSRLVVDTFAPYITSRDAMCITVTFGEGPQNSSYVYVDSETPLIESFSVNSPISDIRLYDTLISILRSANLAMYMPGDCPPLVAKAEVIQHLPTGMIEALGSPRVVTSGVELVECIANG